MVFENGSPTPAPTGAPSATTPSRGLSKVLLNAWICRPVLAPAAPVLGLVVSSAWHPLGRRFQPRVVYTDGHWEDLPVAELRAHVAVDAALVTPDHRLAVATTVLDKSRAIFTQGITVPDWEVMDVSFPPGSNPPAPTGPVARSARTAIMLPGTPVTYTGAPRTKKCRPSGPPSALHRVPSDYGASGSSSEHSPPSSTRAEEDAIMHRPRRSYYASYSARGGQRAPLSLW